MSNVDGITVALAMVAMMFLFLIDALIKRRLSCREKEVLTGVEGFAATDWLSKKSGSRRGFFLAGRLLGEAPDVVHATVESLTKESLSQLDQPRWEFQPWISEFSATGRRVRSFLLPDSGGLVDAACLADSLNKRNKEKKFRVELYGMPPSGPWQRWHLPFLQVGVGGALALGWVASGVGRAPGSQPAQAMMFLGAVLPALACLIFVPASIGFGHVVFRNGRKRTVGGFSGPAMGATLLLLAAGVALGVGLDLSLENPLLLTLQGIHGLILVPVLARRKFLAYALSWVAFAVAMASGRGLPVLPPVAGCVALLVTGIGSLLSGLKQLNVKDFLCGLREWIAAIPFGISAAVILWGSKLELLLDFFARQPSAHHEDVLVQVVACTIPLMVVSLFSLAFIAPVTERRWNVFVEAMGTAPATVLRSMNKCAAIWGWQEVVRILFAVGLAVSVAPLSGTGKMLYLSSALEAAAFFLAGAVYRLDGVRIPVVVASLALLCGQFELPGFAGTPLTIACGVLAMLSASLVRISRDPAFFCFWRHAARW